MMDENGSLFAMTPSHFPLVAFGGQPKRGYLGIGASDSTTDLPGNVDDITRLRKERDEFELLRAKCEANPFQRMCLVGVRKLEGGDGEGSESRLRRLLDGPEPSPSVIELPSPTPTPIHSLQDDSVQGWLKANVNVWATFITVLIASVWFTIGIRGKHPIRNVQLPPPILLPDNQIDMASPLSTARPMTPPILKIEALSWEPEEAVLPSNSVNGGDDGEESDNNAEDEPGMSPQPGRRKPRRGKRGGGKRKKMQLPAPEAENGDPEHSPEIKSSPLTPAIQPTQPVATSSLVVSDVVLGMPPRSSLLRRIDGS
jgi:serine/threonine-protein kinase/endoribonuclease IRE1